MSTAGTQLGLFDERDTVFETYHRENPAIYAMFCTFAFQLIDAGAKHIGSKQIMERVRFETAIRATGQFKCNNNFTPHYARLFEKDNPQHAGLFETRKSKADRELGLEK